MNTYIYNFCLNNIIQINNNTKCDNKIKSRWPTPYKGMPPFSAYSQHIDENNP